MATEELTGTISILVQMVNGSSHEGRLIAIRHLRMLATPENGVLAVLREVMTGHGHREARQAARRAIEGILMDQGETVSTEPGLMESLNRADPVFSA